MFRIRWRKVLRELWQHKFRTFLVVIAISIGVFAIGVILSTQLMLSRDLALSYEDTSPSHATIITANNFDADFVKTIEAMPEIEAAEARRGVYVRLQTGPDDWRVLQLTAVPDYENMTVDKVKPLSNVWPPPNRELLIERSALGLTNADVGDTLHIKLPDGREKDIRIAGLAHDLFAKLYVLDGVAYGYITVDTLEWLGEPTEFNELRITVAENKLDRAHIQRVTDLVQDKLEKGGRAIFFTFIPIPGQHPLDYVIQAVAVILGGLGFLALLLSGFLVINTISALLSQQTRQIGIMKAVGARQPQIVGMYLVTVLLFGLLALFIAVPLGALGANAFMDFMADFFNFNVSSRAVPPLVLVVETAVALLVPILAGFYPILLGTRTTVREAIDDYGITQSGFGYSWFDKWLMRPVISGWRLSRPLLLSLRNTFRRKKRLALTLATLVLAGSIFMAVFSLQTTLTTTLDNWLSYFQYDVAIQFERPYRIAKLQRHALQIPGVTAAEGWAFTNTRRLRPDGSHSANIITFAPPAETQLVNPTLVSGRWLQPSDSRGVVINTLVLRGDPDLAVGDEMILKLEGKETSWQIVGIVQGGPFIPLLFMDYDAFARAIGEVGQAQWLMMGTERSDAAYQKEMLRQLETRFESVGFRIGATTTVAEERADAEVIFQMLIGLLLAMTALLTAVGSFGLMSTMSMNALERTREIGILRAIGASNWHIVRLFLGEGILIGILSWFIGLFIAWPVSKLMSDAIGQQLLNAPLDYTFSLEGVFAWLVVVILLSALSSFIPAWNASRVTVQEVLAYE